MSSLTNFFSTVQDWLIDAFPAPDYMLMPAAALDISPNSVKYLDGKYTAKGCLPSDFREVFLKGGTIVGGIVKDVDALSDALKELHNKGGRKFVFVAIPENALYLYTLQIIGRPSRSAIMQQIEFSFNEYVPISLVDSTYAFEVVDITHNSIMISVTVAPKQLVAGYMQALRKAGFFPRAIELEAYAVARSASNGSPATGVEMIVDMGYGRAGIIIVKNGLPIFGTTVRGGSKNIDIVLEECKKQYVFWDTRTNTKGKRMKRIVKVIVCGGTGADLVAPLGKVLDREVELANVWQNLFDMNEYIPSIDAQEASSMTTLAGLLLKNKE